MRLIITLLPFLILSSCSTIYYNFWETFGKEKRDLLQSKMESANSTQKKIEKEFKDNLERIRSEYSFKEGELESTYDSISDDYDDAKNKADKYSGEIEKAQDIANDLFSEWNKEAYELSNKKYRSKSLKKLRLTKIQFNKSIKSMKKVESSLNKILKRYKDQVVFLKHNLNAKVVGDLRTELKSIEKDIGSLIVEIGDSTAKAENFISSLK